MGRARWQPTSGLWRQPGSANGGLAAAGVCVRAYDADPTHLLPGTICVAFSSDGRSFATAGGPDERIVLWDTATATRRENWTGVPAVTALAFAPDDTSIASASGYGTIGRWWPGQPSAGTRTWFGPLDDVTFDSLTWAGDGTLLAAAAWSGDIWLWETDTGRQRAALSLPLREWIRVGIAPRNKMMLVAVSDMALGVWDLAQRRQIREVSMPHGELVDIAYDSASDQMAIALHGAPGVALHRGTDLAQIAAFGTEPCTATALAFNARATYLAVAYEAGQVAVWDVSRRTCVHTWALEATLLTALVWHPTAALLAAGDIHGRVWLLQLGIASAA